MMDCKNSRVGQSSESPMTEARIKRYRQFANDALKHAAETNDAEQHANFIMLADGWHRLATQNELYGNAPALEPKE